MSLPPLKKRVWVGATVLGLVLACALFARWLAPHDPLDQDLMSASLPPAWSADGDAAHFFGTDTLGRDILSRLIYGARPAMIVAFGGATLAALIGTALGLWAGFQGGVADMAVSRLVDVWMSFPAVLLSIVLVAVIGTGLSSVVLAIAIIDWTRFCRVIRAETMSQAAKDYVTAAETVGFSRFTILAREILPNVIPIIITLLSLEMGIAVIVEAILSFVGLSTSSDVPTWGGMIAQGRQILHEGWWVLAAPLATTFATVRAINLLGDGLQRSLDPVRQR